MRYISVCSGIEAATVAWHSLGWEPVAFAEIDAFPSAVLAHHFPTVPNLGDISKVDWRPYHGTVDLVVGGTPCQSFSIAGRREGMGGASGLVHEYFRLLDEVRPRWFVWENVPGAFSSHRGKDFESILGAWNQLGYHVAWRVLDAQYFGVPQRRRRIFAVGHSRSWQHPVQILFEPESLRRNTPAGGKARKEAAPAERGTAKWPAEVASTLNAAFGKKLGLENQHINEGAPLFVPSKIGTLAASGAGTSRPAGQGNELDFLVPHILDYELNISPLSGSCGPLLKGSPSGGGNPLPALVGFRVRRLTPTECERLQGFPDGWTDIPWRGKDHAPDGPRYKALGNSMAVPCMRWIGERIQKMEEPCLKP